MGNITKSLCIIGPFNGGYGGSGGMGVPLCLSHQNDSSGFDTKYTLIKKKRFHPPVHFTSVSIIISQLVYKFTSMWDISNTKWFKADRSIKRTVVFGKE